MASPATLRRATDADAAHVAAVWHDSWHASHAPLGPQALAAFRSKAWFAQWSAGIVRAAVLVSRGDALVGFAAWHDAEVGQLFVSQSEYGSGIAEPLLALAEAGIRADGHETAVLVCRAGNWRARRFYEKHGWTVLSQGRVADRPSGLAIPVWHMEKSLLDEP